MIIVNFIFNIDTKSPESQLYYNNTEYYSSSSIIKRKVFYSIITSNYESNPRNFRDKNCKNNSSFFSKNSLNFNKSIGPEQSKYKSNIFEEHAIIVIATNIKGKYKGYMITKLAIAFGAGFISFLSPCVLPIIPGYISYITGKKLKEIEQNKEIVLIKTIIFSLGFSVVFISLGAAASAIGNILLFFSNELRITAGIIIIIFSLQLLGFLNFNFMNQEKRIQTKSYKDNYVFPFIVGSAFAFGWTPCIGPVLGSIIALSATEATITKGIILLSSYSLGLAIPFILSGYFMNQFLISKKSFSKHYEKVTKTGGVILLITGILILTNQIQVISYYILTTFPFLTTLG